MVFQTGSKPLKNITPEEAKKHSIGFATGHDFTPRSGTVLGRMNYIWAKAFDDWTPMGPALVHSSVIGVVPRLRFTTKLNCKVVQEANIANMIFKPHEISLEESSIMYTSAKIISSLTRS
jgi:2-keto-4-pentenoate hydratase/2-oxohepta-3-ene-1,7-dioic acid hydratase in catechol pathway